MTRGRPKQFDEREALQAAMEVFWKKGYEAASCEELLAAMKINCGSMYATFGDKKALFEKAFELYVETVHSKVTDILNGPGTPLENIRALIEGWGEFAAHPECRGCFVTNSIVELGLSSQHSVVQRSHQLIEAMRGAFEKTLQDARDRGELTNPCSPKDLAATLMNTAIGLTVMSRAGTDLETLRGIVKTTLTLLH
ncbi:TetR family transcriptional regulator [Planctomycetales bacterium 10988]|nr:TetR family transcriptional regulator [Planctomycetales bacterium 10988]